MNSHIDPMYRSKEECHPLMVFTEITVTTDRICHEDKSPHGFAAESETLVNIGPHLWAEAGERASWLHGNPVTTGICSASLVKD